MISNVYKFFLLLSQKRAAKENNIVRTAKLNSLFFVSQCFNDSLIENLTISQILTDLSIQGDKNLIKELIIVRKSYQIFSLVIDNQLKLHRNVFF